MGEIDDAIERADREAFTREPPKTLKGQIGYLIRQLGSAKAVAREIGVTADSVNRYRRGARKHARPDVAAKIDDAVRQRWQPQVRKRRQKQAATATGITVETRARFGYTAPVGTTDDGRFRRLTVHLPGVRAAPVRRPQHGCRRPADAPDHRRRLQRHLLPGRRNPRHRTLRRHSQRHRLPRPRLLTAPADGPSTCLFVTGRFSWPVRGRAGELSPRSMGRKRRTASVQAPDQIGSQRSGVAGVPAARVGVEREAS